MSAVVQAHVQILNRGAIRHRLRHVDAERVLGCGCLGPQAAGRTNGAQERADRVPIDLAGRRDAPPDHIRKTPKFCAPLISLLWHADSAMPTAWRVSRGSIIASSARRPVAYRPRDWASAPASTAA